MSLWLAWLLSTWLYLLFVIGLKVDEHWIMKFSWWINDVSLHASHMLRMQYVFSCATFAHEFWLLHSAVPCVFVPSGGSHSYEWQVMLVVLVAHACGKMPMLQWWSSQLGPPVGRGSTLPGRAPLESQKWMGRGNLQIGIQSMSVETGVYCIRWLPPASWLTAKFLEAWLHDIARPSKSYSSVDASNSTDVTRRDRCLFNRVIQCCEWKEGEHLHQIEISGCKSKFRWIWVPWLGLFSANWSIWNQIAGLWRDGLYI